MLEIGSQIKAETLNIPLTVKKKLGEGGQGAVYLVEGNHGLQAVKWYNADQSTEAQKLALQDLVQKGPPKGIAGRRFIWPLDLVTAEDSQRFGYLMPLIDKQKFAELGEVWAHIKPAPGFNALCEISYQVASSYYNLHISGHCYRDISDGNLMFDPQSGDVLICDNDNVGVNNGSESQVWGTMEYMAPEIIKGEAKPSTLTDLHSLAVLLFHLWVWHHPMHGEMEYQFRCWDIPTKKRVYGLSPFFIFHPSDTRNQLPNDPDYSTARKRWGYCPKSLKDLFTQAFTMGLQEPARRVTEGQWQNLFLQLKDSIVSCNNCRAENFWELELATLNCWHCNQSTYVPPKLVFTYPTGKYYLLLKKDTQILERHVNPAASDESTEIIVGQVVQNPSNPQIWGIRNLTNTPWTATLPDGKTVTVLPQKARPINAGLKFNIRGTAAEIIK